MDRRLGRPLPHQLPNPTRANPKAINLSPPITTKGGHIRYYSKFPWAIPYLWAYSHALLTRPPLDPKVSLDLHVLGLPPAFVLSQDQTLKLKRSRNRVLDVEPSHIVLNRSPGSSLSVPSYRSNPTKTVKLTLTSSEPLRAPSEPICVGDPSNEPNRPHISSVTSHVKEQTRQKTNRGARTSRRARPTSSLVFPALAGFPSAAVPSLPLR